MKKHLIIYTTIDKNDKCFCYPYINKQEQNWLNRVFDEHHAWYPDERMIIYLEYNGEDWKFNTALINKGLPATEIPPQYVGDLFFLRLLKLYGDAKGYTHSLVK